MEAGPLVAHACLTLFSGWLCRLQGDWVWLKKFPVGKMIPSVNQNTKNLFSQVMSATAVFTPNTEKLTNDCIHLHTLQNTQFRSGHPVVAQLVAAVNQK